MVNFRVSPDDVIKDTPLFANSVSVVEPIDELVAPDTGHCIDAPLATVKDPPLSRSTSPLMSIEPSIERIPEDCTTNSVAPWLL